MAQALIDRLPPELSLLSLARLGFDYHDQRTLFALQSANRPRALFALSAAALAVILCLMLDHFELIDSYQSFVLMSRHKCARVLLVTTAWALYESLRVIISPSSRARS